MNKIFWNVVAKRIQKLKAQEVVLIFGARRVGKTYFIQQYLKELNEPYIYFNGEDIHPHELLAQHSAANYKWLVAEKRIIYFDEAQKIINIGSKLKLMIDEMEAWK